MRILIVDEESPNPPNSGKRIRTLNLIKPLAKRHEIIFLCRYHRNGTSLGLEPFGIRTIFVNHPIRPKYGPAFYLALCGNLFSRYPYSVTSHRSRLLRDKMIELKRRLSFDLLHCEWTPYAVNLDGVADIPAVVDAHNVESRIWERHWRVETNPLRKTYFWIQWRKMLRFEAAALKRFSRVIVVSDSDRFTVLKWVRPETIEIIDNGVDPDFFCPQRGQEQPYSLVFTGALDWRANVDAVLYFLDAIWPAIRSECPDASFWVVGRNPPRHLQERVIQSPGATLHANVDDIRPFLHAAQMVIVPLRIGGGSRLKILEAWAAAKPVVATAVGAEGLQAHHRENIWIAETTKDFRDAIGILSRDSALRTRLGENGRRVVEERYRWDRLADKLEKVWCSAVKEKCRTRW